MLPPPSANPQLEALNAAVPVLTDAIRACGAGRVTPAGVAALESAIGAFSAMTATWQPPYSTDHAWWMGAATVELGRAELELGRVDAAHAAFERAEQHYIAAGAPDPAAECRERLSALAEGRSANFDSAASRQLRILIGEQDPLARAKALTALAAEMRKAGDRYEAARLAEEAASLLVAAGYPDPEPQADNAMEGWIDTARQSIKGDALMAHLMNVGMCYVEVLGDRAGVRSDHDPEGTDRAQHTLQAMGRALSEMYVECEAAHQSVAARLDFWYTGNGLPTRVRSGGPGDRQRGACRRPRRCAVPAATRVQRQSTPRACRPGPTSAGRRPRATSRGSISRARSSRRPTC